VVTEVVVATVVVVAIVVATHKHLNGQIPLVVGSPHGTIKQRDGLSGIGDVAQLYV